jgi:hypothetical protein
MKLIAILFLGLILSAYAIPIPKPEGDKLCLPCVTFMSDCLEELEEIIANGGIIGGCAYLCGLLKNNIYVTICEILCDVVGIDLFIHLIEKADLDPIWICQEITVCPVHDGTGSVDSVVVTPPSGPVGSEFECNADFTIDTEVGTGEVVIEIEGPGTLVGDGEVFAELEPNKYQIGFQWKTEPQDPEPEWLPGTYKTIIALCEGQCGSKHSHTKTLGEGVTYFNLTE